MITQYTFYIVIDALVMIWLQGVKGQYKICFDLLFFPNWTDCDYWVFKLTKIDYTGVSDPGEPCVLADFLLPGIWYPGE